MARPKTKNEIITQSITTYETLIDWITAMPIHELLTPFDFREDSSKKEAHWLRDSYLRDVLIHLSEWHHLLIEWVENNRNGQKASFLPEPYNWKTYGQMNQMFTSKHQQTALQDAYDIFVMNHKTVMTLLDSFDDTELFTKGHYPWVGGSTLGSYFISCTSAHYNWALKKLKAHRKACNVQREKTGNSTVMISACLVGEPCRYDGGCFDDNRLQELIESGLAISFCPEVAGGLPTPRPSCEIIANSNPPRVINKNGVDHTASFKKGAHMAVATCKEKGISLAILKSRSPSCGSRSIYDGSFTGKMIEGEGLATQALREAGVHVFDDKNWNEILLFGDENLRR